MSHSPAWNPEEKRNDSRMRRGTSRDRQQNGGLPPVRNFRGGGGYNNKDGGYGKDRGYDGGRRQHNRNRVQEPDHHFLPHHNPGLNFEPMRAPDGMMAMPRSLSRQWNGPSPPMHSSTPSPIPSSQPPTSSHSSQQSLRQMGNGRKKEDRDVIARKSPEIGSKLDENRDDIPYVAAGTAPVNRNGNSPIPMKSASPVPMPLVTNFAGPVVMTVNRSYPPGFEDQFDVRSNSSDPQKPHFASNSNQDNRQRRDKRYESRPHFVPTEHERQVINQLSQMNVFQQILKGNTLGSERDMRIALERLADCRMAAEQQQQQHRNNSDNRRRERISEDDRQRTYSVSGRPIPRFSGDENAMLSAGAQRTQKSGGGDLLPSDEMVPTLMKFMQQQSGETVGCQPPEEGFAPIAPLDGWPSVVSPDRSDFSGQESSAQELSRSMFSTDSSNENTRLEASVHPLKPSSPAKLDDTSPVKQNYSTVVARSSRSSTSDVPKEGMSPAKGLLYSMAASNANEGKTVAAEGKVFKEGNDQRRTRMVAAPRIGNVTGDDSSGHFEGAPDQTNVRNIQGPRIEGVTRDEKGNFHRGAHKEGQRGGGTGFFAAFAATNAKQRNADHSLNPGKTQPPSPPPTTPVDQKGQFEVSKMDVLSEQIWHYHNSITQTEAMLQRKLHLRDMLYYAISPIFPMCGLYVVGSSLNGFGNNSSDMDLCLMITNKDLDQKTDAVVVLNMILSTLSKLEWVSNQQLILAKVPILRIKFTSPWQDITVDLNANNSVAIKNTHLLCYYSSFDWRVRPLVSVVKEWAKRKGINDANRSSFTSYSLVLMVIHYLQCGAEPPILPSLQIMFPKRFNTRADVRMLNVTQPLQHPVEEWHYQEKTTLGELFIGFLNYYATKFDYDRDAISVRQGRRVDRAVLARHRPNGVSHHSSHWRSQWRCICIEEPFTQSNTAHSIYDEMVFDAIKTAFRDAHDELEKNRDLQSLLNCKPISVSLPHNGAVVYAYENNSAAATDSSAVPSPTQDLSYSCSANSLQNAMVASTVTRSSSSANSVNDGEETEKEPQPERPRRKSAASRRHHSNHHHHHNRKASSNAAPAAALVASS